MKIVNILNFRKGLATNSSSTHSVIYKNKEDMFEDLNIFELNYYGRCDSTIAATREAKIKYLFADIFYSEELANKFLEKYPEALQYKEIADMVRESKGDMWETFGNHSRGQLFCGDNIEFSMKFLENVIEDENKVIIGGSDEMDFFYDTKEDHQEVTDPSDIKRDYKDGKAISNIYKNGNYYVAFAWGHSKGVPNNVECRSDFTSIGRIRFTFTDESPIPERPELVDLKITNYCSNNCPMCFEGSSKAGKHADINKLIETIDKVSNNGNNIIEYSIGGGNVLDYPHLETLFKKIKDTNGIICITIKATDTNKIIHDNELFGVIEKYVDGIGVSVFTVNDIDMTYQFDKNINKNIKCGEKKYITAHMIPEYLGFEKTYRFLQFIRDNNKKTTNRHLSVLFLGYKSLGRGETITPYTLTDNDFEELFKNQPILGIDTLFAQRYDELLKKYYYMEKTTTYNEGEYSMYIDAVENIAYKSSYDHGKAYPIEDYNSINEIFRNIRKDNGFETYTTNPCDTCLNNKEYLNGGECHCSKVEGE